MNSSPLRTATGDAAWPDTGRRNDEMPKKLDWYYHRNG